MNTKIIKIASLALLTGIFSFLSFHLLNINLIAGDIGSVWPIIVSFWIFLILIVLETLFIRDYYLLIGLVFVQSLIPILAFSKFLNHLDFIVIGVAVLFLFSLWGVKKGHHTVKNNIEFRFFFTSHRIVPKIVTGILLFVFIALYFNYIALGNFTNQMANRMFDGIIKSLEPTAKIWLPDFSFDMKVGEALEQISFTQLKKSQAEILEEQNIDLDQMSESARNQLIGNTAKSLEESIEKITGDLNTNDTVKAAVFAALKDRVDNLPPLVKKLTGGGILLIFFFSIKAIAFLVYPLIELTAFVIYKILDLVGFTYITLESKQQEVIRI